MPLPLLATYLLGGAATALFGTAVVLIASEVIDEINDHLERNERQEARRMAWELAEEEDMELEEIYDEFSDDMSAKTRKMFRDMMR